MGNTDMKDVRYVVVGVDGVPSPGLQEGCKRLGIDVTDAGGNWRPLDDILAEYWEALKLRNEIRNGKGGEICAE